MFVLKKYKSFIMYIIFGIGTTAVNIAAYYICVDILAISNIVSNIIAWVCAVSFAYVTNRKWVFESTDSDYKGIIREVVSFFSCRLFTGLLDLAIMYIFVDCMHFNNMAIKCISNIIVIMVNYIASKLIIFRKNDLA